MNNLYSGIRQLLTEKNKGRLSRILIQSGLKPKVNKKASSPFDSGIVVFSADFEMAWAYRYSKILASEAVNTGLRERCNCPVLMNHFNNYNIPVTWATVGHLFLDKCTRDHSGKTHNKLPRPDYFENLNWSFLSGDWYDNDPGTGLYSDPAWYAPDLIKQLLSSGSGHEIGCHTFSHVDFTYENCPKELADAELEACIKVADSSGIRLKSMVFPGGTSGNYESLREKGFTCYRKSMKYHIDLPYLDSFGLVAIPSSHGLDKDPYGWSKEFHIKLIRKFIEKAAKHKLVCHFWFHPSMDEWYLENVMSEIIKIVAGYRDQGRINVMTMGELAEMVLATEDRKT
jgi:peptidoglycan/xylan/chitin deacetylase (PgdA/CDA1 family)